MHGSDGRIDLLAGYRYALLTDGLDLVGSVTSSGTGGSPAAGHDGHRVRHVPHPQ